MGTLPSFQGGVEKVERVPNFSPGQTPGICGVGSFRFTTLAAWRAGFSLAYSLATALFGGFTPAVSTYLIHTTGNKAMATVWLSFAVACGLIATLLAGRQMGVVPEARAAE